MSRTVRWIVPLPLALLLGCQDPPTTPAAPQGPAFAISDGAHDGNPHVFFLPPMVPDASSEFSAAFDGSLDVVVHICVWNTTDKTCGPALEMYNRNAGPGSETVRVPDGAEYYLVNWHTDQILDQFPLGANEVYRIRVLVGSRVVAYADVQVVGTAKALKNVNTGEFVPLLDGRTLPIKVRIEAGWEAWGAVETVDAGDNHTCSLTAAGKAYCWGSGLYGQLGNGTFIFRQATPVEVSGNHTFTSLSAGWAYTCGITTGGEVWCWGSGSSGNLGNNTTPYRQLTPVQVLTAERFTSLAAGAATCGVTTAGKAYCWGFGGQGQLGNNTTESSQTTPVEVSGNHAWASLSAANYTHTCGVTTDGEAYCWGYGGDGELGTGNTVDESTPARVLTNERFTSLSAGEGFTCGISTAGKAYCWGYGVEGELGNNTRTWVQTTPVEVWGSHTFASVSGGGYHTCAVTTAGEAYCWGWGGYGQLGIGNIWDDQLTPARVLTNEQFTSLSAGFAHTCGVTTAGQAYCWGFAAYGQLGDGTNVNKRTPTHVLEPPGGW